MDRNATTGFTLLTTNEQEAKARERLQDRRDAHVDPKPTQRHFLFIVCVCVCVRDDLSRLSSVDGSLFVFK
jgi:hypothetical protein